MLHRDSYALGNYLAHRDGLMTTAIIDPIVPTDDTSVDKPRGRGIDIVFLLSVYLLFLMAIPADLVFAPLGAAGGPATMFALLLFVLYMSARLRRGVAFGRYRQPIRLAALLFACSIVASYVSANRHTLPTIELNGADRGLIFLFGWLGVLLLAADGIDTVDRMQTLLRRIVLGVTAMSLIGIVQFFARVNFAADIRIPGLTPQVEITDLLSRGSFVRPSATASHPLEFGAVLIMTLPLAIHQARFADPAKRLIRWVQVALILMTIPLTVSRSAILGLVVVAIVILPVWPRKDRLLTYIAGLFSVVVIWLAVPSLLSTIADLFLKISSDSSAQSRSNAISQAGTLISQHPWLGRGVATFTPVTYFFVDDQYLYSLITTGIIGFVALVVLLLTGWSTARSSRRMATDPESRHLAQCLAASIAAAAVSFATYDALSFPMASGLTFLLLGCCGAYWRMQYGVGETELRPWDLSELAALIRRHFIAVGVVLLIALGIAYVFKQPPHAYEETGTLALTPASSVPDSFGTNHSLILTGEVMVKWVAGAQGQERLRQAGVDDRFNVTLLNYANEEDPVYKQPYLIISATADSQMAAHDAFTAGIRIFDDGLVTQQVNARVAPDERVTAELLEDSGSVLQPASTARVLGGLAFLTIVAVYMTASFLDRRQLRPRRKNRRKRIPVYKHAR
jgi:polysaccharide biosynthesis protein PslJ